MFNGGRSETRKIAYLAQIYDLALSDAGGGTLFSMHHIAAFGSATHVECHAKSRYMEENLFVDAPRPENGVIGIAAGPGFGLVGNRDVLKETRVKA